MCYFNEAISYIVEHIVQQEVENKTFSALKSRMGIYVFYK